MRRKIIVIIFPHLKLAMDTHKIIKKVHPEWYYSGREISNTLSKIGDMSIIFGVKRDNFKGYDIKKKYIYNEWTDTPETLHNMIIGWMNEGLN